MTVNTYQMQEPRDCGPAAVSFAGGWPIDQVKNAWPGGWRNRDAVLADLNDWPDDHRLCIEKLGKHVRNVTLSEILEGRAQPDRTVILVHKNTTQKHWVVLAKAGEMAVFLHFGDGHIRSFPRAEFITLFTRSFPNCAYEITDQDSRLPWYRRVLGWFAKLTGRV